MKDEVKIKPLVNNMVSDLATIRVLYEILNRKQREWLEAKGIPFKIMDSYSDGVGLLPHVVFLDFKDITRAQLEELSTLFPPLNRIQFKAKERWEDGKLN